MEKITELVQPSMATELGMTSATPESVSVGHYPEVPPAPQSEKDKKRWWETDAWD